MQPLNLSLNLSFDNREACVRVGSGAVDRIKQKRGRFLLTGWINGERG